MNGEAGRLTSKLVAISAANCPEDCEPRAFAAGTEIGLRLAMNFPEWSSAFLAALNDEKPIDPDTARAALAAYPRMLPMESIS